MRGKKRVPENIYCFFNNTEKQTQTCKSLIRKGRRERYIFYRRVHLVSLSLKETP